MAWQIQYGKVDLPSVFQAAQNAKTLKEQQTKQDKRLADLMDARQSAVSGDPSRLAVVAPDEYAKLYDSQLKRADLELRQQQAGVIKPSDEVIAAASRISPQNPRLGLSDPRLPDVIKQMRAEEIAARRAGATNISNVVGGNMGLEKPVSAKVQEGLIESAKLAPMIEQVKTSFDPSMFTMQGKGLTYWAGLKDKIGLASPEDVKRITMATNMRENIEQIFNQYRKEITGAGASVKELELLKNSLVNTDMGPEQFTASLNRFIEKVENDRKIAQHLLSKGLPVNGDMIAKMGLAQQGVNDPSVDAAFESLRKKHRSPEEALRELDAAGVPR